MLDVIFRLAVIITLFIIVITVIIFCSVRSSICPSRQCGHPVDTFVNFAFVRDSINTNKRIDLLLSPNIKGDYITVPRCRQDLSYCHSYSLFCGPKEKISKTVIMNVIDEDGLERRLELEFDVDKSCHCIDLREYEGEVEEDIRKAPLIKSAKFLRTKNHYS